ncbi:MAG: hypothetical protein JO290_13600 [Sphingomonadaceae bacterium]|nr:hypothetical protein [Sphingomonadaceae bacterium]
MGIAIEQIGGHYTSAKLRIMTSTGERFFLLIDEDGLHFYSDRSSSGALSGEPVYRSVDDLMDWIGNDGEKKPFRRRAQVKARQKASTSPPQAGPPATS